MVSFVRSKERKQLNLPGRNSFELMSKSFGSSSTTVRLVEIEPGPVNRGPHLHNTFEEVIHVLEGSGLLKTSEGDFILSKGDTVCIPAGVLHQTINNTDAIVRLICLFPVDDIRHGTKELESWSNA